MFSKIFGKKKESETVRRLEHPRDLKIGDVIQMIDSFGLPEELRGEALTVKDIHTYQYKSENEFEFTLQGSQSIPIYLCVENEGGETWLNFSLEIQQNDVDSLFTLDAFAEVFNEDLAELDSVDEEEIFGQWVATHYKQEYQPVVGYEYNKDYRQQSIPEYVEDGGNQFENICLMSDDERNFVNINVYEDGETDVFLGISRPLADLAELFPGN